MDRKKKYLKYWLLGIAFITIIMILASILEYLTCDDIISYKSIIPQAQIMRSITPAYPPPLYNFIDPPH